MTQTPWVGLAVVMLLVVVVASYRQTCFAYPNGGGAFVVSRDNLGETAALVAASALLVDYVMTVAVSVVSGVVAITSALPELAPHAVAHVTDSPPIVGAALLGLDEVAAGTRAQARLRKELGEAFARMEDGRNRG